MNPQDSTTVTFSHVYNDFKDALNGVADALKVGAEHVYQVLVMQQVVNSITWLLIIAVLLIAGGITLKFGIKDMWNKDKEVKDHKIPLLVIGSIVLIASVIVLSVNMSTIITGFVNPEYGAIMEIKSFIK